MASKQFESIVELMRSQRRDDGALDWFYQRIDDIANDRPIKRELPERLPLYPPRNAKRTEFLELRWRHLEHVDDMARSDKSLDELRHTLRKNYEHFFGRLRQRRRDEVPSDEFRKEIMVSSIIGQVEARRVWLQEQAAENMAAMTREEILQMAADAVATEWFGLERRAAPGMADPDFVYAIATSVLAKFYFYNLEHEERHKVISELAPLALDRNRAEAVAA